MGWSSVELADPAWCIQALAQTKETVSELLLGLQLLFWGLESLARVLQTGGW